ncbi:MAG: Aminotransferase class-III [Cenarchaeum symbiont of Oopsacas minuta]|nr:Aminotransferase class-III [Cenarchaeum symbiont of Oopsacas minuta]
MVKNSHVWHPNTQMSEWGKFDKITSAKGMYLIDSNGRRYIDGVASMWCNVWGHSKIELVSAIKSQAAKLQHSSMFNLTNEPVELLAKNLIDQSPNMKYVFFSDNGSTSMEIAAKMAIQYWSNVGESKTKIVSLKNGYHGDTFGSMSLGYVPDFFSPYKTKLFDVTRVPSPDTYRTAGYDVEGNLQMCLEKTEQTISKNSDSIAALVMESGAQMAAGARIYPSKFQHEISKICTRHNILLVLDEVATGFGRLGHMAEYTHQQSRPDIVSYGKMMTGGYLTMGATLSSKKIYESFLGKFTEHKHLFHGHTFTGNPLAAAVACKNIQLYKKEHLLEKVSRMSKILKSYTDEFYKIDAVGDVRSSGLLMGIELVSDKSKKTPICAKNTSINKIVFEEGKKHGIYLRTLGNVVMLVPPLAIPKEVLDDLVMKTRETIQAVVQKISTA